MPNLLNQTILLTPLQIIYVMKVRVKRRENERRKQIEKHLQQNCHMFCLKSIEKRETGKSRRVLILFKSKGETNQ